MRSRIPAILILLLLTAATSPPAHAQIRIDRPFEGERVGNTLEIEVALEAAIELQSITAEVEDRTTDLAFDLARDRFAGTLSLLGFPAGDITLVVTATDANGNQTSAERTFIKDAWPQLILERPAFNTIQKKLEVSARCVDDDDNSQCGIELWTPRCEWWDGNRKLATGSGSLETEIDTSITGTGHIRLCLAVLEGNRTVSHHQFGINIEPELNELETAPLEIVDVSSRMMVVDTSLSPPVQPALYDRASGRIEELSLPDSLTFSKYIYASGRLIYALESGAAVTGRGQTCRNPHNAGEDCYYLYVHSGGETRYAGRIYPGYSLRAAGDYVTWNRDGELFLHHAGRNETVQFASGFDAADITMHGEAVYAGFDYQIYRFDGAQTTRLTSEGKNLSPMIGDGIVAYIKERDGAKALMVHNGSSETELASGLPDWAPENDFLVSDGWVAFKDRNNVGQMLLRLRAPDGSVATLLTLRSDDRLEDLSPEGEVSIRRIPYRHIISRDGTTRVSSGNGESVWMDGWKIVMGRSLAEPGNLPSSAEDVPAATAATLTNYPNPFSGSTTIEFHLQAPGAVSLELFDLLGRRVDVLASGFYQAGSHRVDWRGMGLPAGVYLARLQVAATRKTHVMVLTP